MRIRHPKKEKKAEKNATEEKKHFTLEVHDSSVSSPVRIGLGQQPTKNS